MQNIMFWLFLEVVLYIIKIINIYIYLNSVFSYIWMYYLFKLCCIFLFNILVLLLLYVLFIFNANKSVMGCKEILVVIWMVNARVVTNFTKKNLYFGHIQLFFFFFPPSCNHSLFRFRSLKSQISGTSFLKLPWQDRRNRWKDSKRSKVFANTFWQLIHPVSAGKGHYNASGILIFNKIFLIYQD